jgi:integrase
MKLIPGSCRETEIETMTAIIERIQESDSARAIDIIKGIHNNYEFALRPFTRFLDGKPLNAETVREYYQVMNDSTLRPGTILHRRCAIRHALRKLCTGDPTESVKMEAMLKTIEQEERPPRIQAESKRRKAFNRVECDKLLDGARSDRQRVFIRFLWNTGLRISEMLNIKESDIRPAGPERVRVYILGKGRKQRELVIPSKLIDDVKAVFISWKSSEYIFKTTTGRHYDRNYVSRQIGKLSEHVLKQRFTAHSLRHSCATDLLDRGAPIEAVAEFLGHSSPSITLQFYSHRTLSDDEILARCV